MSEIDKIYSILEQNEIDCVSFDIFDTLIYRPFNNPKELFLLLDPLYYKLSRKNKSIKFSSMRIISENESRKNRHTINVNEVTLKDIYDDIVVRFKVPYDIALQLMKYEIKLECLHCYRNEDMVKVFDNFKKEDKKIIIISDMYLPKNVIIEILGKNDISIDSDSIFISSEFKETKFDGRLFSLVLDSIGLSGSQVLHIGDDKQSDCLSAHKYGIKTILIAKKKKIKYRILDVEAYLFLERIRRCGSISIMLFKQPKKFLKKVVSKF